jgi:hypothetical protein
MDRAAQLRKRIANLVLSLRLLFVEQGGVPENVDTALKEIEGYAKSE